MLNRLPCLQLPAQKVLLLLLRFLLLGEALFLGLIIPKAKHKHYQEDTRPLVPGAAGIEKHPVEGVTEVAQVPLATAL